HEQKSKAEDKGKGTEKCQHDQDKEIRHVIPERFNRAFQEVVFTVKGIEDHIIMQDNCKQHVYKRKYYHRPLVFAQLIHHFFHIEGLVVAYVYPDECSQILNCKPHNQ